MKLIYEDEYTRLIHGNSLDPEDSLVEWVYQEVLCTDPPYGMDYVSHSSKMGPTERIIGDRDTTMRDVALELWGNVKPALVFGTWRMPRPPETRQLIVWHKGWSPGMGDLSLPWGPSHEEIYVLGGRRKGDWTMDKRGPSVIRSTQQMGSATKDHNHPTPKPVALMQELIRHTVGSIADPFAGSGATLVAASMMRRQSVGVEIDLAYCDAAARRLERVNHGRTD